MENAFWYVPFLSPPLLVLIVSINWSSVVYRRLRSDWPHHGTSYWSYRTLVIRIIDECYSLCRIYSDSGQRSDKDGNSLWSLVIVRGM